MATSDCPVPPPCSVVLQPAGLGAGGFTHVAKEEKTVAVTINVSACKGPMLECLSDVLSKQPQFVVSDDSSVRLPTSHTRVQPLWMRGFFTIWCRPARALPKEAGTVFVTCGVTAMHT